MSSTASDPPPEITSDLNRSVMENLVYFLLKDMRDDAKRVPSLLECARKLMSDNSVTIASVRRGDFGKVAQEASERFPFNDDGSPRAESMVSN